MQNTNIKTTSINTKIQLQTPKIFPMIIFPNALVKQKLV